MAAHSVFLSKIKSKNNWYYLLFFICVTLLVLNILSSQSYPSVMYRVMDGDAGAIAAYLKQIWGSRQFDAELAVVKRDGNKDVLNQMQKEENERVGMMRALESATKLYPYAPEPYFNLSLLYRQQGDAKKADEYLRRARQIDPHIQ